MATVHSITTADQLWAAAAELPSCELIQGELRYMAPASFDHGWMGGNILSPLWQFVRKRRLGRVVGLEAGFIVERNPDTVLAPDVAFVSAARVPASQPKFFDGPPDLAVEVLSPSNSKAEIQRKVAILLGAGCRLIWVVDPKGRTVTEYRPHKEESVLTSADSLSGHDVVPGFVLPIQEIFE